MRVHGYDVWALLKDTFHKMGEDKVSVYAAQMAYAFFFALFPLLLFFAGLLGVVADKQTVMGWVNGRMASALPGDVTQMLGAIVTKVVFAKGAPGILSFGLLMAAWSGSSIFGAFRQALNAAYEVKETRPWWKLYALQLGSLLVAGVVLLLATAILINGNGIMSWLGTHLGLGQVTTIVWTVVQYPLALAAVGALLWVLYLYLPDSHQQNRKIVAVGAIAGTVLWIAATLLFRLYVQLFHAMNPAYGAIGAIMVLLTWMYYSCYVLLAAGELNSVLEKGPHRNEQEKGGRVASSVASSMAARNGREHHGIAALLGAARDDATRLVRRELALARLEASTLARDLGVGTALLATSVALALLGTLALVAGIILLAGDQWLPADLYWVAALIVIVLAGGAAYAFASRARRLLTMRALAPRETIETLQEDVQWTRQRLTSSGRSS